MSDRATTNAVETTAEDKITPGEIKEIRGKYGLSQKAFAQLLGIGEASMVRYENGQEPSKANANLIRAAKYPRFMLDCLQRDGGQLSDSQRKKTEQIVYSLVYFNEEGEIMDINDVYMLTLEQEVLNEQAAEIIADVTRLYFNAQESGDKVHEMMYDDILKQLARAKRQITGEKGSSKTGVAEIRGQIEAMKDFALSRESRAA